MTLKLAPTNGAAGPAPAGSTTPSCKALGCEIPRANNHQDLCQPHYDAYLTRAYELTWDIGRGSHE